MVIWSLSLGSSIYCLTTMPQVVYDMGYDMFFKFLLAFIILISSIGIIENAVSMKSNLKRSEE